jgi:aquaporin Z
MLPPAAKPGRGGEHPIAVVSALESRASTAIPDPEPTGLAASLRDHWPEYLIESALLGAFMISACLFCVLLEHPSSPVRQAVPDGFVRRVLMGLAMGGTAVAIIYSPWGKRSGAHINPATTFTFLRLGKVAISDALFYALAQCGGAVAGVLLAAVVLSDAVGHPAVNFAATVPGERGAAAAFLAEVAIAFVLMTVVLAFSSAPRRNRYTGLAAGTCVALFIAFEAPFSGMSMNPARSLGSAASAMTWRSLWIYFTAPPIGMLLAAEARLRLSRRSPVLCAKLHHENPERCIFRCAYPVCGPPAARRSP